MQDLGDLSGGADEVKPSPSTTAGRLPDMDRRLQVAGGRMGKRGRNARVRHRFSYFRL